MATQHLIELGHRRIGYLGTAAGANFSLRRADGWRRPLAKAAIPVEESMLGWAGSGVESGIQGAIALIQSAPRITAMVIANVLAAIGAVSELQRSGIRIPKDLSVIAIHNTAFASYIHPALTRIKMPLEALGERAVDVLLSKRYARGSRVSVDEPAPELIVRHSTASMGA
jgi:LacI family transcriptional regulator